MGLYGEAVYGEDVYEAEDAPAQPPGPILVKGRLMKIERLFEIMFADPKISNDELRDFALDHQAKLKSNNDSGTLAGQLAAMVADTGPLVTDFVASLSTRDSADATRQGQTITKDDALKAFVALARKRETRIADKLGKPSAGYEEFFPHGLSEFTHPTMAQAPVLMDRMVEKATKFVADTGADLVAEFTAARTAFNNARSGQLSQKGEVGETIRGRNAARTALEVQLQKNVLTIALKFVGQPERATDFFDQSLLENPVRKKKTTPPAPAPTP